MNISNIHAIMVKSVKINQDWNEVKDFTTEIGNVDLPTRHIFLILSVTHDRHHSVAQESLVSKCIMSLKSEADTIQLATHKVTWI